MTVKDSLIKKNRELSKPLDIFNAGFLGGAIAGGIPTEATGGTTSTYTSGGVDYKVHTFLRAQNGNAFEITLVGTSPTIDYLIVAGGGAGGNGYTGGQTGGGGGAGGMKSGTFEGSVGSYTVTVGAGGLDGGWRGNNGGGSGISEIGRAHV